MLIIECKKPLSLVLVVLGALFATIPWAKADGKMSTAEVLELLPTGPDMHDPREKANLAKLINQGEEAFAGLLDIIRTDNSPYVAGRALAVLQCAQNASPMSRREVVTELGKVLYERKSLTGYRNERTLSLMAETIADMGEASDAMLLLPLLDHPSGDVRSAGYSGMEKLAAKAVFQESPAGDPFGQDNGNASTEREPVPQAKKTYRDYPEWELLPKDIDCEDEEYQQAYQRLVDEGEAETKKGPDPNAATGDSHVHR